MPRKSKSKGLRGYSRINKNRWRTPAGQEITDYQYRSRIAKKQGWKSLYEAEKFRKSRTWRNFLIDINETPENFVKGKYVGPDVSYKGRLMRDAYVDDKRRRAGRKVITVTGQKVRADTTPLGRLLIAMGRIPSDAEWEYVAV